MDLVQNRRPGNDRQLGWDVVLFFALYVIAPSYLAAEFHRSLPLLTLSRALLLTIGIMLIIRRRNDLFHLRRLDRKALNFGLTANKLLRWGLLIYFLLLLLSDIALFPADRTEALKAIFVLLLEEYTLVWLLSLILDTRKKLLTALQTLVIASGVTAVISIIGCIIDNNPFHWLNTVERATLMTSYYRLGVLRADAGFGHPVFYGAFCAVMIPIHMYFVENSAPKWKRIVFSACLSFNLVGLFLSNSRGSQLAFCCIVVLVAFLRILRKEFKKFLRTYIPVLLTSGAILAVVLAVLPYGFYFFTRSVNSLIHVFFPNFTFDPSELLPNATDPNAPTLPLPEYGENAAGTRSRLVQLTGIYWTLTKKPLFGFGSNAHTRGLIAFQFVEGQWWPTESFDMGLVGIVCQYGIVGLLGYTALYGSFFLTTLSSKFRKDPLMHYLGLAFICYMLCLLTINDLPKMAWVLFAAIVCLVNIIQKEQSAD